MLNISTINIEELVFPKRKHHYTKSYLGTLGSHMQNLGNILQGNPPTIQNIEWLPFSEELDTIKDRLASAEQIMQKGVNALAPLTPSEAIKRLKAASVYMAKAGVPRGNRSQSEITPREEAIKSIKEILTDINATIAKDSVLKVKMAKAGLSYEAMFRD